MKKILVTTALGLFLSFIYVNAQDIIVKNDNARVLTHVVKINESSIQCKGLDKSADTTFSFKPNDLKMIIYEIGNIQYFNENKKVSVNDDYSNASNATNNITEREKKKEIGTSYNGSIELGGGFTGGVFQSPSRRSSYNPFEINARGLYRISKEGKLLIGINLNYSNLVLLSYSKRTSGQLVLQVIMYESKSDIIYFNALAGLGFFEDYSPRNIFGTVTNNRILPMAHVGFGIKHFFNNSRSGLFIESGFGGPYLLNTGFFFY
jgi:hypothetical protein